MIKTDATLTIQFGNGKRIYISQNPKKGNYFALLFKSIFSGYSAKISADTLADLLEIIRKKGIGNLSPEEVLTGSPEIILLDFDKTIKISFDEIF